MLQHFFIITCLMAGSFLYSATEKAINELLQKPLLYRYGRTDLMNTIMVGKIEQVKKALAEKKDNIEDMDDYFWTPLMYACCTQGPNQEEIVTALIAARCDINKKTPAGTALHVAAHTDNIKILELLLKHGARPNIYSQYGRRCILEETKTVEQLIDAKQNPEMTLLLNLYTERRIPRELSACAGVKP